MMCDIVSEGDHVVLVKSFDSENIKIVPVLRDTIVHYGKLHFNPSSMIGSKFGSVFEIIDGIMVKVDNFETLDDQLSLSVSNKMSTFDAKSQFSQEKIIKKKKRTNHANIVTVVKPTLLHINIMMYARGKLGGLRPDSLSQVITMSNIQNGSRCLLLDHNLGLLTAAVMSRILPDGICIQLISDPEAICTTRKTLNMLNINRDCYEGKLVALSVRDLYKICKDVDDFKHENVVFKMRAAEHIERVEQLTPKLVHVAEPDQQVRVERKNDTKKRIDINQTLIKKDSNREMRNKERVEAADYLRKSPLTSIIIAVQNDDPLSLLRLTYDFLALSGKLVVYSDTLEPLLECYEHLKTNSMAVSLSLSESWLRRFQVLPDRTRPEMNTSGYGGYLLSGTKALFRSPISDNVQSDLNGERVGRPVMDGCAQ